MKTRVTLADLSPKHQAQVSAQLHATPRPRTVQIAVAEPMAKKRLRQNSSGLNKTEAAFLEQLKKDCAALEIEVLEHESVTLRIANGCRYSPDFITVEHNPLDDAAGHAQTLRAYEVKGFMRPTAPIKLKVAANRYPWIKFHLVTKKKGGGWDIEEVLP